MIEVTLRNYLAKTLSAPVYLEIPENPPDTFVLLERTGGGGADHVNRATFAIKSYAGSMYAAAALNELVKDSLASFGWNEADVSGVKLNSDYNFTDTTTKKYRYQAVFEIKYYEEG